jgi:hypothetical protein
MVYRAPKAAPASRVSEERRGRAVGRYCHGCNQVFAPQKAAHSGDPIAGRDHVASTCPYEGWRFTDGASWWEAAVEVLPPVAPPEPAAGAAAAGTTVQPPSQPQTTSAPQQGQPAPAPPKG